MGKKENPESSKSDWFTNQGMTTGRVRTKKKAAAGKGGDMASGKDGAVEGVTCLVRKLLRGKRKRGQQ